MKSKLRLGAIVLLAGILQFIPNQATAGIESNQHRQEQAAAWAMILADSSIQIGIFEYPGFDDFRRVPLANGTVPENAEGYHQFMSDNQLFKINSVKALSGTFDTQVIFEKAILRMHPDPRISFFPYTATRWVLCFRDAFAAEPKAQAEWLNKLKPADMPAYINASSTRRLSSDIFGYLCLQWNDEYEAPEALIRATEQTLKDLQTLIDLRARYKVPEEFQAQLQQAIPGIKDEFVRMICEKMGKK